MQLDDILSNDVQPIARKGASAARSAGELVEQSAVQATGKAAQVTRSATSKSPATATAVLVLAALGGLVVMRRVFAGAIS